MQLPDSIKKSSLFAGLNKAESDLLAQALQEKSLAEGETVFLEQMPGESLYLVLEGTVKVSKMLAEGDEQILAILGPEDIFGELALLDGGPRLATARIAEQARLAVLSRTNFDLLARKNPAMAFELLRNLSLNLVGQIRETQEEYRQMLLWSLDR